MEASKSEPNMGGWKGEMKQFVREKITEMCKSTGGNLEDRLREEKEKKIAAMKQVEKEQREAIKAAQEKGLRKQQLYSPLQALRESPGISSEEKQAKRLEERKRELNGLEKSYYSERNAILEKMRNRPPLFKLSDVSKAEEALAEATKKRKAELEAEEKKRREHLQECALRGSTNREPLFNLHKSQSFEDRLAKAVEKKAEELKAAEKEQRDRIRDAVANGHKKQAAISPLAAALRAGIQDNSERQKQCLAERTRSMTELTRKYYRDRDEMNQRLRTREPLFAGSVSAPASHLEEKAKKLKQELTAEHQKQWQHIGEIQQKALTKPFLMEGRFH